MSLKIDIVRLDGQIDTIILHNQNRIYSGQTLFIEPGRFIHITPYFDVFFPISSPCRRGGGDHNLKGHVYPYFT